LQTGRVGLRTTQVFHHLRGGKPDYEAEDDQNDQQLHEREPAIGAATSRTFLSAVLGGAWHQIPSPIRHNGKS
jgi:hypothetical protein